MRRFVLIGLCVFGWTAGVNAQEPRDYTVNFTTTAPTIDGIAAPGEWDSAAAEAGEWTELQDNGQPDLDNNRFQILWDQDAMYILGQTGMEEFAAARDDPTTDFNTEASVNIYFDPDTDGTGPISPNDQVDGYQVAFSLREGFAALEPGGIRTFGNGVDGHQMAIFMEAHVNTRFGDNANWVSASNPDDFELGDRFPEMEIAHNNVNGTQDEVGFGVWEAKFPWSMWDANTDGDGNEGIGEQEGIFHPMAPAADDQWIFSVGNISGLGGGLFVNSNLPIWADGGANFAMRQDAPGHGVLTFAGAPEPRPGTVLGTGTDALVGGDLTDVDNDGDEAAYAPPNLGGFDAEFFSSDEPGFGGGEFAFNVFDNTLGGGNDKWCCGTAFPQIVGADLGEAYNLTSFTVSSGNDTPARDPRVWSLEGSNDGDNWTTIFAYSNTLESLWDERLQVIQFDAGTDFDAPGEAYSQYRMVTEATGADSGAFFQLGEIELFGTPGDGGPVCGDFDGDGDVDTADRTIQTANWTGALPPGDPNATKTFAEGDCDGDGDVDTADQNGLINNWTGAQQQPAGNLEDGGDADLVYNPATGNVTLDASDTASGVFISFVMATGQNNMMPDNLTKSADGSAGPFFDVGTNTDATTFQIGQTDPLNQGAGPEIDLGDIFPAGMDLAGLSEYLTLADYASALGEGGTLDLVVVPEPSSIALLLLGAMGLVARRRRK